MNPALLSALRSAGGLALFAAVTVGLIAMTQVLTKDRILAEQRAFQARTLLEVLPATESLDHSLLEDTLPVPAPQALGLRNSEPLFLVRDAGQVTALATPFVAPDGYSGAIRLLLGLTRDGTITGVRVLDHRETPGLGDGIEHRKSAWIESFNGRSLANTPAADWAVRKDGGTFDAFTGATITPRAVVKAVHNTLQWYDQQGPNMLREARNGQ